MTCSGAPRPRAALTRIAALAFCAFCALAAACSPKAPEARAPGESTDLPDQPPIAQVHVSKCGSCHARVLPGTRTRNQLDVALARHRKRVKLTPDQWKAMVDYLAADTTPHP